MKQSKVRDLCYIALAVALTAVCAWIQIPMTIPFTLQTFAVVTIAGLLGPWRALTAMAVYLLLGVVACRSSPASGAARACCSPPPAATFSASC